jgi:hypothetical protein
MRIIKDPVLGKYSIKVTVQGSIVQDENDKQIYKSGKSGNEAVSDCIKHIGDKLRLVDTDKTLTLAEFQKEAVDFGTSIEEAFKIKEVE